MTPTSPETPNKMPWSSLSVELRYAILGALLQDGCSVANAAAVSREWQTIIEPHNFARIKLTTSRLNNFDSMMRRNRTYVDYIWLCLELKEYDCDTCWESEMEDDDRILIKNAIQKLFSTLSTWEPEGDLQLDISIHSPSDSEHSFPYLTFEPDGPMDQRSVNRCVYQALDKVDKRGNVNGTHPYTYITAQEIEKLFQRITCEDLWDTFEEETWLEQLPPVPAVTSVLLRQQSRRRWTNSALRIMFGHFPRLHEIHYEPWRYWIQSDRGDGDNTCSSVLMEWLLYDNESVRRLVMFENFNEHYPTKYRLGRGFSEDIRPPSIDISIDVAQASQRLEILSASFLVDAVHFFQNLEPSWEWPELTTLTLTSGLLDPHQDPTAINDVLKRAADAIGRMPKLEVMEIWNGRQGVAALFRYESIGTITWRATWDMDLQPHVLQALKAVLEPSKKRLVVIKELLDPLAMEHHGDAIHHLNLATSVARPISLQQIGIEQRVRKEVQGRSRSLRGAPVWRFIP